MRGLATGDGKQYSYGAPKHRLDQLANRLAKILAETRKLNPTG
jgi:hypothetical protein